MAGYRKRNADGPNSEDKALDLFAEMMIEKIEVARAAFVIVSRYGIFGS